MGTWVNADGLSISLGATEALPGNGGEIHDGGNKHVLEVDVVLATIAVATSLILSNTPIPKNARIESVEIINLETADSASDTAVLNVGLVSAADRTTALDADGLVLSAAQATLDVVGERTYLTTGGDSGALIGTTLAENGLLIADADTEVFTAGRVKIRVTYFYLTAA